ncbi:ATP-binding protein [bacterium]|nr:ATP-binding protein [bacterium]
MPDDPTYESEVRIPSDTALGLRVQEQIIEVLRSHQFSDKTIFGIRLAMEEAIINAIKHGNKQDLEKFVQVRYTINEEHFLIEIEDEGPGFDPEDVPDPTAPENLERPSGRGLLLMRAYMTECDFLRGGNICRMRRIRE